MLTRTGLTNHELLQLFEINKSITQARTPAELLGAIREKVMQLIPFYDTGILIVEKDGLHHYDLSVNIHGWDSSEGNLKLIEKGLTKIPHPKSYVEHVMRLLESSDTPIIEDYQQRVNEYDYPFFSIMKEFGYKEALVTALKSGGKTFGTFWLNSLKKNHFKKDHFQLFEAIADQVAIAVNNILANEELQNENRKQAILLEISEHIATTNNKKQLFRGIIDKVNEIIPVDDTGILVLSKDGSAWQDWTNIDNYQETVAARNLNQAGLSGYLPLNDLMILSFNTTGILPIDEYLKGSHPFAEIMYAGGLKEFMFTPLISQGITIGSLFFDSKQYGTYSPKYFDSFKAIANMVASAVSNILANKEILEREAEKSGLLKISEAISKIQNKGQLLNAIYRNVAPVFPFDSAGLFIIDHEKDLIYEMLDAEAFPDELQKSLASSNNLGPWKVSDSNLNSWWMRDEIVIRTMHSEAELAENMVGDSQFKEGIKYGLRHFIGGPMYANGKKIGALCFNSKITDFYSEAHISMFKSISEQISIAVANILANEEIIRREKEKALLLYLSTELLLSKSITEVTKLIYERIKTLIHAEGVVLTLLSADRTSYKAVEHQTSAEILAVYQGDELYKSNFNQYVPLTLDPFISGEDVFNKKLPHYVNVKDVLMRYPNHGWAKLMRAAGSKSTTAYVLRLNNEPLGALFWHWRDELARPDEFFALIQGIGDLAAITISNLLSVAELQERAKQIEVLNQKLEEQNAYLEEEILGKYNFTEIIGESPALKNIYHNMQLVSKSDTTVLITGESGTGKELIARALHEASDRRDRTLIKLNCAALPAQLVESELFGHEKGAFTGAMERRIGKFELAHESTIFLDEVGELSLDLQAKLLRVLQEKELERLGGNKVIKTNVRVLSATNRDLQKEVQAGRFRSDLYYRLNVFPIHLPPLRDRKEDIPPLVHHFLRKYQKKLGKQITSVSNKVMNELINYSWPGNIRELEHVLERSCILCSDKVMRQVHLPQIDKQQTVAEDMTSIQTLADNERNHILRALRQSKGKVSGAGGAAELLNMKPTTLEFRMKKLGIRREFIGM